MGQVYRAKDTTLGRQVAIKILPDAFASDPERLARFEREAMTLASLNHPHIAGIYAVEKSGGTHALVMELVEGEDLSTRIERGAIPLDEALPIAKQIAEALEAAHEQGIVHRDLKPANIKLRADGTVKVLDFGLAKAMDAGSSTSGRSGGVENSPTLTSPAMTQAGMILGTAAYMSPEQAKGRTVDKRADIWAFGVIFYEMLSGRHLFAAEDVSETLAAVLTRDLGMTALPAATPMRLRRLLARCLDRDPRMRLRDIGEARIEIDRTIARDGAGESLTASATSTGSASGRRLAWMALAVATVGALAAALSIPAMRYLRKTLPPEMRVEISTPSTLQPLQFALSPDGRQIVFVASGDGRQQLWLRPLDKTEAQRLAGTEGADYPFWSADSRSLGFFAAGKLYRIDIAGGSPQVLATAASARGGTWSADGTILFAGKSTGGLARITATGGEPVAVTRLDPTRQISHRFPQFLPDGRHFIFHAVGLQEASVIYLGSLDGGEPRRLTAADSSGGFVRPDQVVVIQQGTLVARRLDLARGELTGDPVTVANQVGTEENTYLGGFSVSGDGQVAYRVGGAAVRQLTWFDRTGKAVGVAGEPDANNLQYPELSPDGRRLAMTRTVQGNFDVWVLDLIRGGLTRVTFDAGQDSLAVWSPDGMRIAFASARKPSSWNVYLKASNGSGTDEVLLETPSGEIAQDWSSDGRFLVYYSGTAKTGLDLWALEMTGSDRRPRVIANTPFQEAMAQVSPDGRWVAYQTNESGRDEIVVQPFPDPGGKWQVSTGGGAAPRWRADSREIYFLAPDATMMAVAVTASGPAFEAGSPVRLFPTRIVGGGSPMKTKPQYAVARDGRFLINQSVNEATAPPITLLMNWTPLR